MNKKKSKQKQKSKPVAQQTIKGRLEVTRSGMGYVVVDDDSGDVLVRPGDFTNALNGDTVRVKVIKENLRTGKKEGKITEVVSRKQTEFIGHLQLSTNYAFFIPDTDKPMPDLFIPLTAINGAKNKDRVVARLVKWDRDDKKPVGEVVSVMLPEDENDAAMKELLAQAGFPLFFPEDVKEEAERLPEILDKEEIKKRKDCRDILTFTIDPADAKDFDDALSIRKLNSGMYEIGVHIADVSHYVIPETELDEEAYKRATSVYLPDRVNPMLPERISNELCSLRPNEDKLTFSAIFQVSAKGEIKQYWLGKTVIHSDHRFTYEDVQETIETKKGLYLEEIMLLNEMAQRMRKKRFSKGAINFSSQEVRFRLDEKGKPIGIVVKESKEAHQLIEEFMLLANRTVAENVAKLKINKKPLPFPYRIHDQPDEEKLKPFMAFALKHGHVFDVSGPEAIAQSFNRMLADVKGKPEQHVLEQLGIRTMAKAIYTTENIGHYGLGFEHYCHFTSPIRRYPDVLVHRVLESVILNKPIVDKKMEEKCKHCSTMERSAMDAERAGNKYKQVEFMSDFIGDEFDGVVWIRVVAANLEKRQLDYEWIIGGEDKEDLGVKAAKPKVKQEKKKERK
ncbi:MAG: hypothetical protein NVSMB63_10860 [Sediminibacterium sp.]